MNPPSLMQFVAKQGGLNPAYAHGLWRHELQMLRESGKGLMPGILNKKSTRTFEEHAGSCMEAGYIEKVDVDCMLAALAKDVTAAAYLDDGERVYGYDGETHVAELEYQRWLDNLDDMGESSYITREMEAQVAWHRQQTLDAIRRQTDTVILSFSRGKDSLASWCVLLENGFRVIPFHCEIVPGLSFVEESLQWYERHFQTKIYRTIHPVLYHYLAQLRYQPYHLAPTIDALVLPAYDFDDVREGVARTVGIKETKAWGANGVRVVDSITRRNALIKKGPINWEKRFFMPIFDMRKEELIAMLKRHGVKLPIDYAIWGRSWDGIDYRYLKPLKEYFPADYAKVLQWFPLAHLEFTRAEIARRHGQSVE